MVNRIKGIHNDPNHPLSLNVFVKILPKNEGSSASLEGYDYLKSHATWTFQYQSVEDTLLSFTLTEGNPTRRELAKLTLPLTWFEKNTFVKEMFPMRSLIEQKKKFWAKVKIHLSENGEAAFFCPRGRLLVNPKWKKNNQQAQAPPPYPPVLYPQQIPVYAYPPPMPCPQYAYPQQMIQPPIQAAVQNQSPGNPNPNIPSPEKVAALPPPPQPTNYEQVTSPNQSIETNENQIDPNAVSTIGFPRARVPSDQSPEEKVLYSNIPKSILFEPCCIPAVRNPEIKQDSAQNDEATHTEEQSNESSPIQTPKPEQTNNQAPILGQPSVRAPVPGQPSVGPQIPVQPLPNYPYPQMMPPYMNPQILYQQRPPMMYPPYSPYPPYIIAQGPYPPRMPYQPVMPGQPPMVPQNPQMVPMYPPYPGQPVPQYAQPRTDIYPGQIVNMQPPVQSRKPEERHPIDTSSTSNNVDQPKQEKPKKKKNQVNSEKTAKAGKAQKLAGDGNGSYQNFDAQSNQLGVPTIDTPDDPATESFNSAQFDTMKSLTIDSGSTSSTPADSTIQASLLNIPHYPNE